MTPEYTQINPDGTKKVVKYSLKKWNKVLSKSEKEQRKRDKKKMGSWSEKSVRMMFGQGRG